jgi:MFS transporter, ACS family, glucarate transporter
VSAPRVRVRWNIFLYLFGFGFVAYFQQRGLTVAAADIMPHLHLTQRQIGYLLESMLLGYTVLQFPGGVIGQRVGARWMFVIISLIAFAATVSTPLAPVFLTGGALYAALLAAQLLLGSSQGPIFPVSAGVFEAWFPSRQWALVQGLQSMGLQLGAALTPPVIASLMVNFGWQRALAWSALPVLALIGGWAWYGRNTPEEHPRVGATELAELDPGAGPRVDQAISWSGLWVLIRNRDILALTASYICMNYVFYLLANWSFLYLLQERHFTRLEGGWLASTPPLAAAIGAGIGGYLASVLAQRYGVRLGLRIIPLVSIPAAGVLQFAAVDATNAYMAVAALALCYAAVELNEGPYWAAIMHIGRADTMSAAGILNTGGNLGGLICTPIVAHLSEHHEWTLAFLIGTAFAAVSAALWLLVDPSRVARVRTVPGTIVAEHG